MSAETGTQSVDRAIAILKTFTHEESVLGVTEISQRNGLHKSTAHRLIAALEREGLLSQDPGTGRYRLGLSLLTLAGRVQVHEELQGIARPKLQDLAQRTRETANLSVLDGGEAIIVERVLAPGRQMLSFEWVGRRAHVHAVSTGKVLLAFLPEDEGSKLMEGPLPSFTPATLTDRAALKKELNRVRRRGYATDIEELEEGLSGVAAPVRNSSQEVIAAVAISGPSSRITGKRIPELAQEVLTAAERISHDLNPR